MLRFIRPRTAAHLREQPEAAYLQTRGPGEASDIDVRAAGTDLFSGVDLIAANKPKSSALSAFL
ncbi:MAG: hypothetical protein SGJ11_16895 [Phycisphaerae bacterium]|nr:hypothetical protein [Phycisphaerae bacterium]